MNLRTKGILTGFAILLLAVIAVSAIHRVSTANELLRFSTLGLLIISLSLVALHLGIISPITNLTRQVQSLTKLGDKTLPLIFSGDDEIAKLTNSINFLLESLKQKEAKLITHNCQIQTLMDAVPLGILSINADGTINSDHSKKASELLGANLANKNLFDILDIPKKFRDKLKLYLAAIRADPSEYKSLAQLNPINELAIEGSQGAAQWLQLAFYPIESTLNEAPTFLAVIADITEEKSLTARISRAESENLQLKALAQDPDLFREFLIDAVQLARRAAQNSRALETSTDKLTLLKQIMRDAHTLKGSAGPYGLFVVAEVAHQLESSLALAIEALPQEDQQNEKSRPETNQKVEANMIKNIRETTALLSHTILEISKQTNKLIGEDIQEPTDLTLKVPLAKLESTIGALDSAINKQVPDPEVAIALRTDVIKKLSELRSIPAKRAFARVLRIIPDLAERLGKEIHFVFEGAETSVDSIRCKEISIPLLHILRNSIDHGIETPAERTSLCKPAQGTLTLRVANFEGTMFLEIEDDGRGLDPQQLREKAVEMGIVTPEEAQRLSKKQSFDLIFKPGFSTASRLTYSSGRGIGMDIVSLIIKDKLDGSVNITSELDLGTRITLRIPQPPLYSPAEPFPYPTSKT